MSEVKKPYKYKALKINGKRIDEHRYVMECILGRKLLKNEVVRHRDRNTRNNVPENLYVITRQEQFKEQLAEGTLAQSIIDGLKRKADGIKKAHKKWHPKGYVPKPIGRPKKAIDVTPVHPKKISIASIPKRPERIYKTRPVDTSKLIPLKLDKKTTVYINQGTPQKEIDRIIKKHQEKKIR